MRTFLSTFILCISVLLLNTGCAALQPVVGYCGGKIDPEKGQNLLRRNRGANNGAQDTNHNGKIEFHETFSQWEFMQMEMVLQQGTENREYAWVNIDTCYTYNMIAGDFYEDPTKGVLYEHACRRFVIAAVNPDGDVVGSEENHACRNFGTHKWEIY